MLSPCAIADAEITYEDHLHMTIIALQSELRTARAIIRDLEDEIVTQQCEIMHAHAKDH